MPSRWVSGYQDWVFRFRRSPGSIAATAGSIGLICGALVVAMTSDPTATNSQVAVKQSVETTAVATPAKADPQPAESVTPSKADPVVKTDAEPKSDMASVSDCDQQAWPYITQQCLAERDAGQRKVRVITTDKIAPPIVSAIETERAKETPRAEPVQKPRVLAEPVKKNEPTRNSALFAPAEAQPAAPAPEPAAAAVFDPASTVEAPATPATAAAIETPHVTPVATPPSVAAPVPVPEPRPKMAATEKPPKAAANEARTKNARGTRDKRTREAKSRRHPAQDSDDGEAYDTSRGRVVERWTEREYVVPSEQGSQRRRVIVILRNADRGDFFGSSARNYPRSVFQY